MKNFLFGCSMIVLMGLAISSCQKDDETQDNNNNSNNNNNNNHNYSECPYKYEGEYIGGGGKRITVFGRGDAAILLASNGFLYDTVRANIDCSLRSYTFYSNGFGSFSEDGNTLIIAYPDYLYTVTETLTKIKSSGIYLFNIEEDTLIVGESLDIPVEIRKFGNYTQQVSLTKAILNYNGVHDLTGSFTPTSGTPDFDAVLRLTADANAFNSGYTVELSASDGSNTVNEEIHVSLVNTGCTSFFAGTYKMQQDWCDYLYGWSDTVAVTVESSNQIRISSLSDPLSMIAEVNCFKNEVSIPRTGDGTGYEMFSEYDGYFYQDSGRISFNLYLIWTYNGIREDDCSVDFIQIN